MDVSGEVYVWGAGWGAGEALGADEGIDPTAVEDDDNESIIEGSGSRGAGAGAGAGAGVGSEPAAAADAAQLAAQTAAAAARALSQGIVTTPKLLPGVHSCTSLAVGAWNGADTVAVTAPKAMAT